MLMLLAELKRCLAAQRRIDERLLDQALAVVECAVDAQRDDIVAPAGELLLLPRAHQPLRVQDDDPHPGPPVKGRRHRAAGVARGRHQDRQRRSAPALQALQALGQEARAEVLERRGRPVKQLEREQPVRRTPRPRVVGAGKSSAASAISPQLRLQTIAREEAARARRARSRAGATARGATAASTRAAAASARTARRPGARPWRIASLSVTLGAPSRECSTYLQGRTSSLHHARAEFSSGEIQLSDFRPCSRERRDHRAAHRLGVLNLGPGEYRGSGARDRAAERAAPTSRRAARP